MSLKLETAPRALIENNEAGEKVEKARIEAEAKRAPRAFARGRYYANYSLRALLTISALYL